MTNEEIMMNICQTKTMVTTAISAPTKKLRLSALLTLCQEAAIKDCTERGLGMTAAMNKGYLWVVAKQRFEIIRLPRYEEEFIVETYPANMLASFFVRHYRVTSTSGEALIKGISIWCLIDASTRAMVRPDAVGIHFDEIHLDGELEFPKGYVAPELSNSIEVKATWANCDVNGHINNTQYLDIAENCMDIDHLKTHDAKAIDIAYKKEVPLGSTLSMQYGNVDDTFYFQSEKFQIRIQY